jgi:hypothetical protein
MTTLILGWAVRGWLMRDLIFSRIIAREQGERKAFSADGRYIGMPLAIHFCYDTETG